MKIDNGQKQADGGGNTAHTDLPRLAKDLAPLTRKQKLEALRERAAIEFAGTGLNIQYQLEPWSPPAGLNPNRKWRKHGWTA